MTRQAKLLISQEEAVRRMAAAHNGFYSYDKAVFTGAVNKLTVTCPLHGDFDVSYTNHSHKTRPRGCPTCGKLRRSDKRTQPVDGFIEQARALHGGKYDYSKIEYKTKDVKVEIICQEHGSFWQTPEKHVLGQNCPKCVGKALMTTDWFKAKADGVHGDRYVYDLVVDEDFRKAGKKVSIVCNVHGKFRQHFNNHLMGQGCPKCATFGFSTSRSGFIYVLACGNMTKVGITNRKPELRAKQVSKSYGTEFSVIETFYFENGKVCLDLETALLQVLRGKYKQPAAKFNGCTECFLDVDRDELLAQIRELHGGH